MAIMKRFNQVACWKRLAFLGLVGGQVLSARADSTWTFSTGLDFSSGKYGDTARTETWTTPISAKFVAEPLTVKVTIPHVRISGPGGVAGSGTDRILLGPGSATRRTVEGMGDIVVLVSREIYEADGWMVELGAKGKFATANADKGLGTGRNDYTLLTDVYRTMDRHTFFSTVGWRRMGDPDGIELRNPWLGSLGWSYRISSGTSAGMMFDFRERLQSAGQPVRELTGFLTVKLDAGWKFQTYATAGFSRASPDFGVGAMVFHTH